MNSKDYLMQVQNIDAIIDNKVAEIQHWQEIATSITAQAGGERVQSSSPMSKVENSVCRYVDIEAEIKTEIDRLVDTRHEVMLTIEQLKPLEHSVLYERYIQRKSFKEIADSLDRSLSWVTSVHGRALQNVQKIIDKR